MLLFFLRGFYFWGLAKETSADVGRSSASLQLQQWKSSRYRESSFSFAGGVLFIFPARTFLLIRNWKGSWTSESLSPSPQKSGLNSNNKILSDGSGANLVLKIALSPQRSHGGTGKCMDFLVCTFSRYYTCPTSAFSLEKNVGMVGIIKLARLPS